MLATTQPWHWRSQPLQQRTGSEIFAALVNTASAPFAALLESPYPLPADCLPHADPAASFANFSICAGPPRPVEGRPRVWTPGVGEILPTLRHLLRQGFESNISDQSATHQQAPDPSLPFTGGWFGWLGYDLAWEIEQLPRQKADPLPFPVAFWYEPDWFAVLDHGQQMLWLAATTPHQLDELQAKLAVVERQDFATAPSPLQNQDNLNTEPTSGLNLSFGMTAAAYRAAVQRAQEYIQAGDIFQANLSLRFATSTTQTGWSVYRQLQQINPSPFASYWRTPWGEVVSCSPERLIHLRDRTAQTRPIAGTRPRGSTAQQDQQYQQELAQNAKENAEHIMLVDLERNDLGRVCSWGSVQVNELLTIERYSHVMHLVSNIMGTLQRDRDPIDLIRAVFPGGTITGCPKVRCMEIIEELEPVRRSLFYGSCGYLDWRGYLDLNILIRTLLFAPQPRSNHHQVWGQVGAGIVADSDPEREWHESIQKAKAQFSALGLHS